VTCRYLLIPGQGSPNWASSAFTTHHGLPSHLYVMRYIVECIDYTVPQNAPTLANCSFDKHLWYYFGQIPSAHFQEQAALQRGRAMLRVCRWLASVVQHVERNLLVLVTSASDLPLRTINFFAVLVSSAYSLMCGGLCAINRRAP